MNSSEEESMLGSMERSSSNSHKRISEIQISLGRQSSGGSGGGDSGNCDDSGGGDDVGRRSASGDSCGASGSAGGNVSDVSQTRVCRASSCAESEALPHSPAILSFDNDPYGTYVDPDESPCPPELTNRVRHTYDENQLTYDSTKHDFEHLQSPDNLTELPGRMVTFNIPVQERTICTVSSDMKLTTRLKRLPSDGKYDRIDHNLSGVFGFRFADDETDSPLYMNVWRAIKRGRHIWLLLLMLGMLSALVSFTVDVTIEMSYRLRVWLTYSTADSLGIFLALLVWLFYGLICICVSIFFTKLISETAIGSGIPQMKAILSGTVLADYLTFRTLCSKVIGLTLAQSSGAFVGKLGPFVHTACIISNLLCTKLPFFKSIGANESLRLQMLVAGCAVGVSSTFGTPIAGVLFSIEVTATYYLVNNYWKGFFCAISGSFILLELHSLRVGGGEMTALFNSEMPSSPYNTIELLLFSFLGVISGLMGALFVNAFLRWGILRKTLKASYDVVSIPLNPSKKDRFIYYLRRFFLGMFDGTRYNLGLFCVTIISLIGFLLGIGVYMSRPDRQTLNDLLTSNILDPSVGWGTTAGEWFFSLSSLCTFKFIFTILCITLPVPCGVFAPVFTTGALFGRLLGEFFNYVTPSDYLVTPGGYAIVGAAAFAAGVTRAVSSALIVFELTGDLHHIIPVLLAVLLSIGIGNIFSASIFDAIISRLKLPVLTSIRHKENYDKVASDVMQPIAVGCAVIPSSANENYVNSILEEYSFSPSVIIVDNLTDMRVIGSISRNDMLKLLDSYKSSSSVLKTDESTIYRHEGIEAEGVVAKSSYADGQVMHYIMNAKGDNGLPLFSAPFIMMSQTPLDQVFIWFHMLMLKDALVTHSGSLVGRITKKALIEGEY